MTIAIKLIILGLLLSPASSIGQENNRFAIDTAKILTNENLDDFLFALKSDKFEYYSKKDGIPKQVLRELDLLTKGFSLADPKQDWQCCCTSSDKLPKRQLVFLAKSKDVLVMTYKTGGVGVSTHLLFIRFDDNNITDLWAGYCESDIKEIHDIVSYVKEGRNSKRGLNTNIVIL